jgi:DHA1 family tetracycline resistance protein-like MFS transporter
MQFLKGPMGFITATMFLNFMGLTIIIPVIPYIVAEYTTHVALYVGLITSVAALCQFLAAPALGYISDIFGRRPVVLFSLLGGVVGYIVFGIGGALWVFFLARIIDGLSSGDTPAMYAYVADVFKPHERAKYYGILGAAAALGFMAGPAIGGFASEISLSAPLYVAAAVSFANACWGYFAMPESLAREHRTHTFSVRLVNPFAQFRNVLTSYTLRILFLSSFVFFTALVMQQSNFSVFMKDILHWGPINIGIVLTVVGLVDFFAEGYLVGRLLPILGDVPVSRVGILLTAVGMCMVGLVPFFPSLWLFYAAVIVYTIGDGLFEPAMTGLIANATEPRMQGRVQGANQSIQSVARFVAPLIAGMLYELSASVPYFTSSLMMVVAFIVLFIFGSSLVFNSQ